MMISRERPWPTGLTHVSGVERSGHHSIPGEVGVEAHHSRPCASDPMDLRGLCVPVQERKGKDARVCVCVVLCVCPFMRFVQSLMHRCRGLLAHDSRYSTCACSVHSLAAWC